MSDVTVESLPEEVLVEVFKWLDTKSLKNVMLTCKEWADYVRRSHQWTLNLTATRSLKGIEALQNRKYNKVIITGWTGTNGMEFLEMQGASIHELKISYAYLRNACKLLSRLPNLKKVTITSTSYAVHFSDVSNDELPRLHKMKTLELAGERTEVLKLFKKCQLHTVTTSGNYSDNSHQAREEFWNFLVAQQDLKELKLSSSCSSALFAAPVIEKSIPFRLKKLSMSTNTFREMPINIANNLMEFMKLHKNTLEDLELRSTFPETVCKFVFSEFKRLKTLSMAVVHITQDSVERLEVNESVTSLQLKFFGFHSRAAMTLVSNLPNVQKLAVNGHCDFLFAKCIADNMKQLKSLEINEVEANTFDGARFPALKSLRIHQLNGSVNWFAFAKNNPGINELWIGDVGKPIYLDVPGLTRNLKLSKLTIQSSKLNCDETFFEVIRKNCPELKSLELNEKSLKVDISTVADIPVLCFLKF